jgi:hypothetical protein
LLQHALRIEKGAVKRDAVAHDIGELVAVVVEKRDDCVLQFVVEGSCIL